MVITSHKDARGFINPEDLLVRSPAQIGLLPNKRIKAHDLTLADVVLSAYKEAFIGGSCVVDPENANDLDIVLPMITPRDQISAFLEDLGFDITMDAMYSDCHLEMDSSWRKGRVNVIVINPLFYSAYAVGAYKMRTGRIYAVIDSMIKAEALWTKRDDRVQLHVNMKSHIKKWITENDAPDHADGPDHS